MERLPILATLLQHGASAAFADTLAEMVEAQNRGVYADDTLPDRRGATSLRAWAAEHLAPIVGGAGRLVS